jgi:signal transduction histidine kinase/ActR/RegA family two-component response regulator
MARSNDEPSRDSGRLPHAIFTLDPSSGRVEGVGCQDDPAFARPLAGDKLEDFLPEDGARSTVLEAVRNTIESGRCQPLCYDLGSPTGRRTFEGYTALVAREPMTRVAWVVQDVTERRKTADQLRQREILLETLIESLPFDLWVRDCEGRCTLANSTVTQRWGPAVGKLPEEMGVAPEALRVWEANNARALAGEVLRSEVTYHLNGEDRQYLSILAPLRDGQRIYGIVGLNLDITDEKRLALELERHQRLESIGVLAGGIAHDFNNYLTVILSGLAWLEVQLAPGEERSAVLGEMQQAALRARGLTRQLLTFVKGGAPVRVPTEVGELVTEAAALASRGSGCRCETQVEPGLPLVDADAEQLRQVVHNLVLNATQAMDGGGTVRVRVRRAPAGAGAPDLVEVAVHDGGVGIPRERLDRVLEPYFTTKPEGHGLGLTIGHSIVQKHGGTLAIDSEPGRGTRVTVRLPCSQTRAAAPGSTPDWQVPSRARLLVMDDDPAVRATTARLLEQLGHRADTAATCDEMLAHAASALADGDGYDVLLFDLTIPGGPPATVALGRLRELDPDVPVVVYSGHAQSPIMAHHAQHGFAAALAKPFTAHELESVLNAVLRRCLESDRKSPPPPRS